MTLSLLKIVAVFCVIVGIYLVLEEQIDVTLKSKKAKGQSGDRQSRFLQSLTGAHLDDQLIEVLLMISSCLKAGRNLDQAFELVAISSPPPICN